jgi:hypothetical protein
MLKHIIKRKEQEEDLEKINKFFPIKLITKYRGEHKHNKDDKFLMDEWEITLINPSTNKEMIMNYYTGIGLRQYPTDKNYKRLRDGRLWDTRFDREETGNPISPSILNILSIIYIDTVDVSFEDFCMECGYDTDSRKALETYLACQEQTNEFRRTFPGVNLEDIPIVTER